MISDDPGTPGNGQWEINAAYLEDRTALARDRSFPHIDLNYGLGDHIQLKYETGYLFVSGPGTDGVKHDVDDSLLGIKWRFLDQEGWSGCFGVSAARYREFEPLGTTWCSGTRS